MSTPSIKDFHKTSIRHDGELRMDPTKGELKLNRYRGGFAGRAVRWLRGKLSSKSTLMARQAANTSAALSFLQALKSYYGSAATKEVLDDKKVDIFKPLQSRAVRDIIRSLNAEQMTHMESLLKNANTHPERGFELLVNLASRNMLDSQGARNILASQKHPKGSSVHCAVQALKNGVQLSQGSMLAIYSAIGAARDNGSARDLYNTLRDNHLLNDPNIAKLFSYMPSGIEDKECAQLYDLIASGFFSQLRSPAPQALKRQNGKLQFSHTTQQLPHAATRELINHEMSIIGCQTRRTSVLTGHIKPFIQPDGTIDAKGFLKNLPAQTQFGIAFGRDMAGKANYRINGKEFRNNPEGALKELWTLSKGEPRLFATVCNLLSDEVWAPLSGKPLQDIVGPRDENAFRPANGQGDTRAFYEVVQGKKGWLDVRRSEEQHVAGGTLNIQAGNIQAGKTGGALKLDKDAAFIGERSFRALVQPNEVSVLRMKSQARFSGPLQSFQPA